MTEIAVCVHCAFVAVGDVDEPGGSEICEAEKADEEFDGKHDDPGGGLGGGLDRSGLERMNWHKSVLNLD